MTTRNLLDPEILPALEAFPDFSLNVDGLPMLRAAALNQVQLAQAASFNVERLEIVVPPINDDNPPVRCLVYHPQALASGSGAYLHLHGGGYILGTPEDSDQHNVRLSSSLGIVVVSVDYRLAPEHPAPAALLDSYAVLAWMHTTAADLKISPDRIAVGGESAGGCLAAALSLYARDQGRYPICFQALTYPMLDDRTGTQHHPADPLTGEFVWTRERNQLAWSYYLGASDPASPIVPARADDLRDLPPTWLRTASHDLFRDENIDFAQRLLRAGISTEFNIYPGTCHGFQMASVANVTKRYLRDHAEALSRGLNAFG